MRTLLIAISFLFAQQAAPTASGNISGRILSMSGAPAVNARVQALQIPEDTGALPTAILGFALTDANGGYRLEKVPAGKYFIAVGGVETPTYFPGVAVIKSASVVSVRGGEDLSGFDFKMVLPQPLKISGRVNFPDGQGLSILRLAGPRPGMAQTGADGSFNFTNLLPGDYEIQVMVTRSTLTSPPLPLRITLTDHDIAGLELGTPPATINVSVSVERGGPQPRFQLSFDAESSGNSNSPAAPSAAASIVPGLRINLLPGKYRARVSGLPDGFSVKSIQANQAEIGAGTPFEVASKDTLAIIVSLGVSNPSPWVKVRGKVSGPETAGIRTVELNGQFLTEPITAAVSPDGSFEFQMVVAGTYYMRPSPSKGYFPRTLVVAHNDVVDAEVSPATKKDMVGDFVTVAPGEFMMGCSPGDRSCLPEETPSHKVRISKGFEIGRFEVTQLQWEAVMGTNPSQFKREDLPVENINTWTMVEAYLEKLNAFDDGYRYRMPTEAEWEYAARAGSTGASFVPLDSIAWHGGNSIDLQSALRSTTTLLLTPTHPGGQLLPNAWGLYDMQGNVWEWTSDWYSGDYFKVSPEADPAGPAAGPMRVMKGGSATVAPDFTRVSMRGNQLPVNPSYVFGLRLVRESIR